MDNIGLTIALIKALAPNLGGDIAQAVSDYLDEHGVDLSDYAKTDGSYESMTVGNAEQLVSTVGIEDQTPYNFRTSGGSVDIGDREELNAVVGGTVAWNQLLDGSVDANWAASKATKSFSDGICTFTASAKDGYVQLNVTRREKYHVYLAIVDMKTDTATNLVALNWYGGEYKYCEPTTNWQTVESVSKGSGSNNNFKLRVSDRRTSGWDAVQVKNFMLFDITAMFGSAIADYVYTLESGTVGAGIAWLKKYGWFARPYYPYKEAALESVKTSAHKTIEFNQWDEVWEVGGLSGSTGENDSQSNVIRSKNYIRIIPNTTYYVGSSYSLFICYYDANKNFIGNIGYKVNETITTPSNAAYMRFQANSTYGTTYKNDICINLHWDGERDGEYEPYEEHTYALDGTKEWRGIFLLDANNNLYADGDIYPPSGEAQRRYGIVDLGTLDWEKTSGKNNLFNTRYPLSTAAYGGSNGAVCNAVCAKYVAAAITNTYSSEIDNTVSFTSTGYCYIEDSAYSDAATFKTSLSGVYLVYKLATPTTESADPYTELQICDDFGTEEFVDAAVEAGERDVAIPVGHDTFYQNNLRAKLEMAPDSPDGNGDYVVRQTNGQNEYVPLVIPNELPAMPSTDGTYTLQVTVADGTATLSWV